MNNIYKIIYVSSANKFFEEEELRDLLEFIRPLNAKNGITGLLVYKDGNFIQALEGKEQKILELMTKIKLDTRHSGIIEVHKAFIEERQFSDWSMAYSNLSDKPSEGFSDFLNPSKSEHEKAITAGNAKRIMLNFRKYL